MNNTPGRQHPRTRRPRKTETLVFQLNCNKGMRSGAVHDAALQLAWAYHCDIVLLQEPWTKVFADGKCRTKTHPGFDTYLPVRRWDGEATRPRVAIYIRKGQGFVSDQLTPVAGLTITETRDVCWVRVNNITFVSAYQQPHISQDDSVIKKVFNNWTPPDNMLLGGDFNSIHHRWQTDKTATGIGPFLANWTDDHGLQVLNPLNQATNGYGNVLDLAITNIPRASCAIEEHLDVGSDHFTVLTRLPLLAARTLPPGKIRLDTEELERAAELVRLGIPYLPELGCDVPALDSAAKALTDLLHGSMLAAGRISVPRGHDAPWWNDECAVLRREAH